MHYRYLDLLDFLLITSFLVIPPVLQPVRNHIQMTVASYTPSVLIKLGAVTAYLLVRYVMSRRTTKASLAQGQAPAAAALFPAHASDEPAPEKNSFTTRLWKTLNLVVIQPFTGLIAMSLISYFWSMVAKGFPDVFSTPAITAETNSRTETIQFTLIIILLATNEELLYRWFLPERLRTITSLMGKGQSEAHSAGTAVFAELAALLLFAGAHRYMGIWAVLNAFCAGFVLMIRFRNSRLIMVPAIIHIVYNLISFSSIMNR